MGTKINDIIKNLLFTNSKLCDIFGEYARVINSNINETHSSAYENKIHIYMDEIDSDIDELRSRWDETCLICSRNKFPIQNILEEIINNLSLIETGIDIIHDNIQNHE